MAKALEQLAKFEQLIPEVVETMNAIKTRTEQNEQSIAQLGAKQASTQQLLEESRSDGEKLDRLLDMVNKIDEESRAARAADAMSKLSALGSFLQAAGVREPGPSSTLQAGPESFSLSRRGPSTSPTRQQDPSPSASTSRRLPIRTYGHRQRAERESFILNPDDFSELFMPQTATSLSTAMSSVSIGPVATTRVSTAQAQGAVEGPSETTTAPAQAPGGSIENVEDSQTQEHAAAE